MFSNVDRTFSETFNTQASSNEERLTGDLVRQLEDANKAFNPLLHNWLARRPYPLYVSMKCVDTTPGRAEKWNGADMAFVLHAHVPGIIDREKVIFVSGEEDDPQFS
jgi:hypothetical protein